MNSPCLLVFLNNICHTSTLRPAREYIRDDVHEENRRKVLLAVKAYREDGVPMTQECQEAYKRMRVARNRWTLALTLLSNPVLAQYRKFRLFNCIPQKPKKASIDNNIGSILKNRSGCTSAKTIEQCLIDLPGVEDAIVMATTNANNQDQALAILKREDTEAGRNLTSTTVMIHCTQVLRPHEVPRNCLFWKRLPRTAEGVVDRAATARRLVKAGYHVS